MIISEQSDTGMVCGYLIVQYPPNAPCIEHDVKNSDEVTTLIRSLDDKDRGLQGLDFYTLIDVAHGTEVQEGFLKRYPPGTKMCRTVCICGRHLWVHENDPLARKEVIFTCHTCKSGRAQ
jgi:hypothetical protein